jgi:hypothetical protein
MMAGASISLKGIAQRADAFRQSVRDYLSDQGLGLHRAEIAGFGKQRRDELKALVMALTEKQVGGSDPHTPVPTPPAPRPAADVPDPGESRHFTVTPARLMSPLFRMAVIAGTTEAVELFLLRGEAPDVRDSRGQTALMLAAARGRTEICRLLLDHGADRSLVDGDDRTAFAFAFENEQEQTAWLLATGSAAAPVEPTLSKETEGSWESWAAEDEAAAPETDRGVLAAVTELQARISASQASDLDQDWSDVVIELPARPTVGGGSRGGRSVRFRRLRKGVAPRKRSVEADVRDALIALDLSRPPDIVLGEVTLRQVIRSADTSSELRRCVGRSKLFDMSASTFLADDDGEARFIRGAGIEPRDYLELADLMNAFTVLVHQEARRESAEEAAPPGEARAEPATPSRAPEEVLATTSLAQIVLNASSSPGLRQALARSVRFDMSAAEFLQEEDGEAIFRDAAGLRSNTYGELSDLVNDFTTFVLRNGDPREWRG